MSLLFRVVCIVLLFSSPAFSLDDNIEVLDAIEVSAPRVAIEESVTTYTNPISSLRYEPFVDLQGRNSAEAQGDVSVRGGIFENTGFVLGAVPLFDPQTGHYFAEIPISQNMLELPQVHTGVSNFLTGFNSSVATIDYGLSEISTGIHARVGGGDFDSNLQQVYVGTQNILNTDHGLELNADFDFSRSESDGTREFGDHDFERVSGRLQLAGEDSQTDLVLGYQDKFFGWQNLYAVSELHDLVGSSGAETEALETTLIMINHKQKLEGGSFVEVGSYYRRNKDDYEFDRFNPGLFNPFEHETEVYGGGAHGTQSFSAFHVDYSSYFIADEIESTALVFGDFSSRSYWRTAVVPGVDFSVGENSLLELSLGATYDDSNRDSDAWSPALSISLTQECESGDMMRTYAEFARTTQLPGYTAIASNPDGGLFRGNQSLSREVAKNYEIGVEGRKGDFRFLADVFYREDDDLVDWTYTSGGATFAARTANNVDIDTIGVETLLQWSRNGYELTGGYTYLSKDEDYGITDVDASFYALNFPKHRFTLAAVVPIGSELRLRVDNEYRRQIENVLRASSDEALFSSLLLTWAPEFATGFEVSFGVDNLFNENFEEVPGVPGRRRMIAGFVDYRWS